MSLTYKDVADIIKIVDASSCDELVVELAGSKIVVRRGNRSGDLPVSPPASGVQHLSTATPSPSSPAVAQPTKGSTHTDVAGDKPIVRSPMVGTFYRSPSPKDPPFVEIGSVVRAGDPLCIIEVMKLFTTVEADRAGRVTAVFPGNAELVEFGQPLFQIESV
ncbi:acetyl-CoA carboxylase biotin carboxyl carrier protein [Nitrobacteraceae bacterium AZCC 1564]